jgi:hypothetical protein
MLGSLASSPPRCAAIRTATGLLIVLPQALLPVDHCHEALTAGPAGEMKSTKLSRFLNQFYSGKACAAAVKIGG